MDLECWAECGLDEWLRANFESINACDLIAATIDTYISMASAAYKGIPEDLSLIVLISMEMWVALDKCVLYQYKLLMDYGPEFPAFLFDPLLLPKRS